MDTDGLNRVQKQLDRLQNRVEELQKDVSELSTTSFFVAETAHRLDTQHDRCYPGLQEKVNDIRSVMSGIESKSGREAKLWAGIAGAIAMLLMWAQARFLK